MRLIDYEDLKNKGIKASKTKIWRQVKSGQFPKPVKIGDRNAWVESEIDTFIQGLIAARDSEAPGQVAAVGGAKRSQAVAA